ncbi:translocon-associated protein subunit beta [Artemisia annua]|uniref:Translocon-associated protein subunit beta n=1 Tax=Artemisia annua TaxID=35608 RepID=A0A2U1L5Y9_ARTAN|nr:translocon-associated protein subunit beta [Artemisia annua]
MWAAYDVSLTDDGYWSPEIFSIVSGNTSTSWEKLDVFGALLSHSFELESNLKTVFYGTPAVITFRASNKAALEAYTTSLLPLEILSDKPQENQLYQNEALRYKLLWSSMHCISLQYLLVLLVFICEITPKFAMNTAERIAVSCKTDSFSNAQRLMGKYGSLISVISMVVLFIYLLVTPPKSGAGKGSEKKR